MATSRFWIVAFLLATCVWSCGGPRAFAPHVVGLYYLSGRVATLEGETQAGYRILVERWEVESLEPLPQLRESEYVLVPRDKAIRDPLLAVGEQIWVDGVYLRPAKVFTDPFIIVIPPFEITAP